MDMINTMFLATVAVESNLLLLLFFITLLGGKVLEGFRGGDTTQSNLLEK